MTTIAYRDGIMAADSGCWIGDARHGWGEKLVKGKDGTLYGLSGDTAACCEFMGWAESGEGEMPRPVRRDDDRNSFIALAVSPGGPIRLLTAGGWERFPAAPYYAIGASLEVALGALWHGATAVDAIKAALAHGSGAFGEVQVIRHG